MFSLQNALFDYQHLFLDLSVEDFTTLDNIGRLLFKKEMPDIEMNDDKRCIQNGDICLAGPETADIFTQCIDDKILSFEECLRNIRIVQYLLVNGVHTLNKYMDEDLLTVVERVHAAKPHNETDFDFKRYPFIHDPRTEKPPYVYGWIFAGPETKSFSGHFSIPSCGETGCGSDFALIQDFEVLIFVSSSSSYVYEIRVLPDILPKHK